MVSQGGSSRQRHSAEKSRGHVPTWLGCCQGRCRGGEVAHRMAADQGDVGLAGGVRSAGAGTASGAAPPTSQQAARSLFDQPTATTASAAATTSLNQPVQQEQGRLDDQQQVEAAMRRILPPPALCERDGSDLICRQNWGNNFLKLDWNPTNFDVFLGYTVGRSPYVVSKPNDPAEVQSRIRTLQELMRQFGLVRVTHCRVLRSQPTIKCMERKLFIQK